MLISCHTNQICLLFGLRAQSKHQHQEGTGETTVTGDTLIKTGKIPQKFSVSFLSPLSPRSTTTIFVT